MLPAQPVHYQGAVVPALGVVGLNLWIAADLAGLWYQRSAGYSAGNKFMGA